MKIRLVLLIIAFHLCAANLYGQTIHVYEKKVGESVTFAWDHTPFVLGCTDGSSKEFVAGVNGNMTCGDKSYSVTWSANVVTVEKWNSDGTNWIGTFKYNYRAYKIDPLTVGGIFITAKGSGEYKFTIQTAGRYIVYGLLKIDSDAGGKNSFFTSMDGVKIGEGIWDTPIVSDNVGALGEWVWWRLNARGAVPHDVVYDFSIGQHTLVLTERESGTEINGIIVLPENSAIPNSKEIQVVVGEVTTNQMAVPLTQIGTSRFEVQSVLNTLISDWSLSTDSSKATVDGVGKGWAVNVTENVPQPVLKPVKGIRVLD